ncbi:hypothetical protein [Amycolatopsis japonica]|uniref:hypothetical protein n=1 Tax=Amycolatopsis japonica TaxID=208439 RepID=UPI0033DEA0F6
MRGISRDEAARYFGEVVHQWPAELEVVLWADEVVVQDVDGRQYGATYREGRSAGEYRALVPAGADVSSRYMQSEHLPEVPEDPIAAARQVQDGLGEHSLAGVLGEIGGVWPAAPPVTGVEVTCEFVVMPNDHMQWPIKLYQKRFFVQPPESPTREYWDGVAAAWLDEQLKKMTSDGPKQALLRRRDSVRVLGTAERDHRNPPASQ